MTGGEQAPGEARAETAAAAVTDDEIRSFIREIAVEGYETDERIVFDVTLALEGDHPGQLDIRERVERLAPDVFEDLRALEAEWPIPTDNDRLDRAFASLDRDGILARQNFYGSQRVADEEMTHEIAAFRDQCPIRGFAFFHGGDTRRAIAGEGLRITFGAALLRRTSKARLERASWEIAQEVHRALWAQGLSPDWSRVVGDPIVLPFTWRRRRRRWKAAASTGCG